MSEKTAKIISISGINGVGKSVFSTIIAKNVENTKTILIDFDLDENQIRTIFKITKNPQYNGDYKKLIIKINNNLDILCHLDILFKNIENIDYFKIQEILNELKKEYDLILIDTSSKIENEYTKRLFYNSTKIIFLLEPNIIGLKKTKNIIEVFENDWRIQNSQILFVLNKSNLYQINESIIEELFPDIKIIGKIKYKNTYDLMLNKNILSNDLKKEYKKIKNQILNV